MTILATSSSEQADVEIQSAKDDLSDDINNLSSKFVAVLRRPSVCLCV